MRRDRLHSGAQLRQLDLALDKGGHVLREKSIAGNPQEHCSREPARKRGTHPGRQTRTGNGGQGQGPP